MALFARDQLVFVDETSKDERTLAAIYGYAERGKRATLRDFFVRGARYSLLAAMTTEGITSHVIVQNSITAQLFLDFLQNDLVRSARFLFASRTNTHVFAAACHECLPWSKQRARHGQLCHPSQPTCCTGLRATRRFAEVSSAVLS